MLTLELRGCLVGSIWWPTGAECWKELSYNITREDGRYSEPVSLREHVLAATNDGDFQSCSIACGELIATRVTVKDGRRVTVMRSWPLERFGSVADCLHPDGQDWFPMTADEDEGVAA
jgi:hypothetical protein